METGYVDPTYVFPSLVQLPLCSCKPGILPVGTQTTNDLLRLNY